MRWVEAGRNPGPMYYLKPGTIFSSRDSVMFSGVHSLDQPVYFLPGESAMAIAVLVSQPVTVELVVQCSGHGAIKSMHNTYRRIGSVRVVSLPPGSSVYTYHGIWMVTSIDKQSDKQATVTMYNMPG